ncbi:hypothetical protein OA848_00445 [Rickettsiales bacterium]|nr:hypothetical protein [Rickettsiales bacterium]
MISKSNCDGTVNSPSSVISASIISEISNARSVAVISTLLVIVFIFTFERIGIVFLFSTTL